MNFSTKLKIHGEKSRTINADNAEILDFCRSKSKEQKN